MKKTAIRALAVLAALAAAATFTACTFTLEFVSATGKVVDARSGSGVADAVVTLTPKSGAVSDTSQGAVTATTGSDGSYTTSDSLSAGTYEVTAAYSGYVFIPQEVTIGGWGSSIPNTLGVATSKGGDPNAVSVFLVWGSSTVDLDAHLTYPAAFESSTGSTHGYASDGAYYDISSESRTHIYWSNKGTSSTFASLDVDKTDTTGGLGPETISMIGLNTGNALGSTSALSSATPIVGSYFADKAGNYYYMGAAEYYVDTYKGTSSLDGQSVKVVITQGSTIIGIFNPIVDMSQKTISVFRALLFYSSDQSSYHLVFVPDYRLVDGVSGIKSLSVPQDKVFGISGTK